MTIYDKLTEAIVLHKLKNNKNYHLECFFKYITEDTVLFLNEADLKNYKKYLKDKNIWLYIHDNKDEGVGELKINSVTIFLPIADNETLLKANAVAKELKEKYGVAEVNVFALHCFIENPPPAWAIVNQDGSFGCFDNKEQKMKNAWFDKLITTNSTDILKIQSSERLQVFNCFF